MLIAVAVVVTFGLQRQAANDPHRLGGAFAMTDMSGTPVTEADLAAKPTALFFGFTRCPAICPTTLQMLTDVLTHMGPDADRLNVVFVTVDPARDTPEQLRLYLSSFDSHIRGLTGTDAQVAAMAAAYHIQYRRVPLEGGDYTIDHTAAVLLFGPHLKFVRAVPSDVEEAAMQSQLEALVRNGPCRSAPAKDSKPGLACGAA